MTNKTQIAVNTIFYILMVLFMIAIIIFGIQKLFLTKDIISEQERLEIQTKLTNAYEYCEDPLNAGTLKHIEIKTNLFNAIYLLGDNFNNHPFSNFKNFKTIYDSGDNVILVKQSIYYNADNTPQLLEENIQIIDSFKVQVDIPLTFSNRNTNDDGAIDILINCT